jgi:hypothetical protein
MLVVLLITPENITPVPLSPNDTGTCLVVGNGGFQFAKQFEMRKAITRVLRDELLFLERCIYMGKIPRFGSQYDAK